jgi:hypothetical protein
MVVTNEWPGASSRGATDQHQPRLDGLGGALASRGRDGRVCRWRGSASRLGQPAELGVGAGRAGGPCPPGDLVERFQLGKACGRRSLGRHSASDTARESPRHAYRERRERATEHRWPPSRDNRRHGPESVNRRWAAIRWPARVDAWSPSVGRNRHRSIFIRVGVFPARRACTGGSGNPTPLHLTAGEAMAFPEAQGRR